MEQILKDIRVLLGLSETDTSKDNIINIYIRRATVLIKGYLNNDSITDTYIKTSFPDAIIQMVYEGYSVKGDEAIKQKTQGSRSTTYKDNFGMSIDSVEDLLPLPYARLR